MLINPFRALKRHFFELLRRRPFTRWLFSLENYGAKVSVVYGLPREKKTVLVLSSHSDDEAIGCGGTIGILCQGGNDVDVVHVTKGTVDGREGARKSSKILGVRSLTFLNGDEGRLTVQESLVDELVVLLNNGKFDSVYCPWPFDGHQDHAATFGIFQEALRKTSVETEVWLYEVKKQLSANRIVPIDGSILIKQKAITSFRSETPAKKKTKRTYSRGRDRSLLCPDFDFAEAFFYCDRSEALAINVTPQSTSEITVVEKQARLVPGHHQA